MLQWKNEKREKEYFVFLGKLEQGDKLRDGNEKNWKKNEGNPHQGRNFLLRLVSSIE